MTRYFQTVFVHCFFNKRTFIFDSHLWSYLNSYLILKIFFSYLGLFQVLVVGFFIRPTTSEKAHFRDRRPPSPSAGPWTHRGELTFTGLLRGKEGAVHLCVSSCELQRSYLWKLLLRILNFSAPQLFYFLFIKMDLCLLDMHLIYMLNLFSSICVKGKVQAVRRLWLCSAVSQGGQHTNV